MLDTPIARRRRELEFVDADINKSVKLTQRPYSLQEFKSLEALRDQLGRDIPVSVRHEILPGLRQGAHDRTLFRYRIMKSYRELGSRLDELATDSWWTQTDKGLSTGLIDALSLLEEEARSEENR
jgi:hypothetical protein